MTHTFTSIVKNIQDNFTIFVNKMKMKMNTESIVNHYWKYLKKIIEKKFSTKFNKNKNYWGSKIVFEIIKKMRFYLEF